MTGESREAHLQRELEKLQKAYRAQLRTAQRNEQEGRRFQEYFDLTMACGSDLLFRMGREGKMRSVSQASLTLLGYEPAALEGRSFYDFIPREERYRARAFVQECLAGKAVAPLPLRLLRSTQRYCELDLHARLVPHPQTRLPELWMLARPRSQAAAGLSSELLAFGLAHELNQPLTAIALSAHACERLASSATPDLPLLVESLRQLTVQTERAAELVRRLRQLAAGGLPKRSSARLPDVVQEALQLMAATLHDAKVKTRLQLSNDLPILFIDRIQIGQVLINLVRNAVEAMVAAASPTREVTVSASRMDCEIVVEVSDTGPGLAPEVAQRLFQPYLTTKRHGMGLGLTLCRSLIQAHGGRIWLKESAGPGSIFCFALPVEESKDHGQQIQTDRLSSR